jgi:hypothetical protein
LGTSTLLCSRNIQIGNGLQDTDVQASTSDDGNGDTEVALVIFD